jgi:DNA polymerase-4
LALVIAVFEIARGRDDRPVQSDRERKSSGSETTFSEDLIDPARIEAGVIAMAYDVWGWCEKTNCFGRTVTVKIKWPDFQISSRSRSIEGPIETRAKLHELALELIRFVFPPESDSIGWRDAVQFSIVNIERRG